jgi:hypothetical protein
VFNNQPNPGSGWGAVWRGTQVVSCPAGSLFVVTSLYWAPCVPLPLLYV